MFEWINLCTDLCIYNCLFGWRDGYTGECIHVLGLTRGRWMFKNGFLLAKMCCFCETSLNIIKKCKKETLYKSTSGSALSV